MDDKSVERRIAMLEGAVARLVELGSFAAAIFVTEKVSKKYFPTDGHWWAWNALAWVVVFFGALFLFRRYVFRGRSLTKSD
jgi:hypothetical protein